MTEWHAREQQSTGRRWEETATTAEKREKKMSPDEQTDGQNRSTRAIQQQRTHEIHAP